MYKLLAQLFLVVAEWSTTGSNIQTSGCQPFPVLYMCSYSEQTDASISLYMQVCMVMHTLPVHLPSEECLEVFCLAGVMFNVDR